MKTTKFNRKKTLSALLGGALLATALPAQLSAASDADDLKLLRQQIEALTKKVTELEQKQEVQHQVAETNQQEIAKVAKSASSNVKVSAGPGGFGIASADGAYSFKFRGLVQFDNRLFFDNSTPASQNKFILRRLRPIFQGTIAEIYDFSFVPELGGGSSNSSSVGLVDAWFSAKPYKEFGLKFGKFASPAALEPGGDVNFVESSLVNNLLPNRDIGIEAFGSTFDGLLDYRAGVFNGARNNTTAFNQEIQGGNKSFAGRLTLNPFIKEKDSQLKGLSFSVGARYGFSTGGSGAGLSNYVTGGQQTLLNWGTLTASGSDFQVNPAIEWYPGKPWSAVAEFGLQHQQINNPANGNFNITNTAWRFNAGYVLTGENRTKRGVKPAKPFDWGGDNWGAVEVVARVGGIHLDNALFDASKGGLSKNSNASAAISYGVGLNWYLNENLLVRTTVEATDFTDYNSRGNELNWFTRFQLQF